MKPFTCSEGDCSLEFFAGKRRLQSSFFSGQDEEEGRSAAGAGCGGVSPPQQHPQSVSSFHPHASCSREQYRVSMDYVSCNFRAGRISAMDIAQPRKQPEMICCVLSSQQVLPSSTKEKNCWCPSPCKPTSAPPSATTDGNERVASGIVRIGTHPDFWSPHFWTNEDDQAKQKVKVVFQQRQWERSSKPRHLCS